MITPSSSNESLNEFDARVFIMIGQSLSDESEESNNIVKSLNKTQENCTREYIANFEAEKVEKTKELENLIEISIKLTSKIKANEELLEKEKRKFKLFSSERKLSKIIEEDMKIYNDFFAKISNLHEDLLNIDKRIAKTKSFIYTVGNEGSIEIPQIPGSLVEDDFPIFT